jgi:type 1 glutamine amidotransferase
MRCPGSVWLTVLLLLGGCGDSTSRSEHVPNDSARILFLTQSSGYVHDVVRRPAGGGLSLAERALLDACMGRHRCEATQDASSINAAALAELDAIVLYTTGELPISVEGRGALLDWVRAGGAFVGVHSATDTLYAWPEYGDLVGAYFDGHPWHQAVRVTVEDPTHPSTRHLGASFEVTDEIYQFKAWRREDVRVLLSLDVSSVDPTAEGVHRTDGDFALAWCKPYGEGRVFYTALGHRPEVWADARFLDHLMGGIDWALGGTGRTR